MTIECDEEELEALIEQCNDALLCILFINPSSPYPDESSAYWDDLQLKHPNCVCVVCMWDDSTPLLQQLGVSKFPYFLFVLKSDIVGRLLQFDPLEIGKIVEAYAPTRFSGSASCSNSTNSVLFFDLYKSTIDDIQHHLPEMSSN